MTTLNDIAKLKIEYEDATNRRPTRIFVSPDVGCDLYKESFGVEIQPWQLGVLSIQEKLDWDFEILGLKGLYVRSTLKGFVQLA